MLRFVLVGMYKVLCTCVSSERECGVIMCVRQTRIGQPFYSWRLGCVYWVRL